MGGCFTLFEYELTNTNNPPELMSKTSEVPFADFYHKLLETHVIFDLVFCNFFFLKRLIIR